MRVISSFCSALFRRMPVCLFGAAALAFAVLTTPPALAESGENPVASCPENADAELFRAAHRGNVERAKHLLSECDADVNARNYHNQTPLTWAIRSGNVDMVALLLDKEADVHARDKAGHTVLHTSVRDNHPEMVEVILAHFRTDVNIKDHYGWTAMDWAAVKGNAHLAGVLKDAGGVCNGRQELPLCNIAEKLTCLSQTNIQKISERYPRFQRWMDRAPTLEEKMLEVVFQALKHEPMNVFGADGMDVARECLEQGADRVLDKRGGSSRKSILHSARYLTPAGVRLLLENGAEVNAKTNDGWTPLDEAVKSHEKASNRFDINAIASVLREFGGECNVKTGPLCHDPSEPELVCKEDVNAKNAYGQAPLHVLLYNNDAADDRLEEVAHLIECGADVNAKIGASTNYHPKVYVGSTPLHEAAIVNARKIAALLIEKGADVHAKDREGLTPLHSAGYGNALESASLLMDNGADIHAKDRDGTTPLHWAALWGAPEMTRLLLENGAEVNAKDNFGATPLDLGSLEVAYLPSPSWHSHAKVASILHEFGGECQAEGEHPLFSPAEHRPLCDGGSEQHDEQYEQLSAQSDEAREDLTEVVAEGIDALPPSFNALATDVGFTRDMKVRLNARRDFRWDGGDWGLEAHIGAVGESDSQAAFTGVGGSKDFAGGWRAVGAAKVARGWTQLEGGLERGALWASEFSAGFERLGLFYGGDALGFGVSQPLHVEHWEAETADGRRFRGSQLSGRVLNVDASYRIPLPGGENGMMEFSAAVGRESGSASGFEGDALISAEWGF